MSRRLGGAANSPVLETPEVMAERLTREEYAAPFLVEEPTDLAGSFARVINADRAAIKAVLLAKAKEFERHATGPAGVICDRAHAVLLRALVAELDGDS